MSDDLWVWFALGWYAGWLTATIVVVWAVKKGWLGVVPGE